MKSEEELNREIIAITLKIREYSPKFQHGPGGDSESDTNLDSNLEYNKYLDSYLDSLKQILKKYEENHRA
ncbi:hypothetical protein [Aquiflexum gelatinilyticum]|uniref:hypothetical protein n=1 Tax=Aquiflexum gelatinilyticum TaxID=2961943 RepID=UPI002167CC8F|nr:hypothetical protein [Aquiflexum gelatinilyticum]MCS4436289.1 hypothetical protein [Aquiflexum gelatinilyticum]